MTADWQYVKLSGEQESAARELVAATGMGVIAARLLVKRGIATEADAKNFLKPLLADLHDPFLMADMHAAVKRLSQAVAGGEKIMVYGDYDVDGCTAVAVVYKVLRSLNANAEHYIPNRYDEGYGVSLRAIDYAAESGVRLMIILDCGVKASAEVNYAKERGIDVIICDHHFPGDELPAAVAVLNPKRADDSYPFKELCGCGVGFKLMQAFCIENKIPFSRLSPMLELCAVSIAADIVPVTGENRILAYHGLRQLNRCPSPGLKALVNICGLEGREVSMADIVFKIGARINAAGRVENGDSSVKLLVENDAAAALTLAKEIDRYNTQRKDIDRRMTLAANKIVARHEATGIEPAIVLYDANWKKGVIGIVASRLSEMYYRPAVVICRDGDKATGSARSTTGFDIYGAIKSCSKLLSGFGGHSNAAGFTLNWDDVPAFRQMFLDYVSAHLDTPPHATLDIDAEIDFKDINRSLMNDIKRLAPFGAGNTAPRFATHRVYDYGTSKVVGRGQEHIKLELIDSKSGAVMDGIAFGQSSAVKYIKSKRSFGIAYTLEENTHKRGAILLQIEDIRPEEEA